MNTWKLLKSNFEWIGINTSYSLFTKLKISFHILQIHYHTIVKFPYCLRSKRYYRGDDGDDEALDDGRDVNCSTDSYGVAETIAWTSTAQATAENDSGPQDAWVYTVISAYVFHMLREIITDDRRLNYIHK